MPKPLLSDSSVPLSRSHLFTVRVWRQDLGDGRSEWRGQVQHALSRQTRYFRDWQMLAVCVQDMLASCVEHTPPSSDAGGEPSA